MASTQSEGVAPTRTTFADKVNQIVGKLGSSSPVSEPGKPTNFSLYLSMAAIPAIGFGIFFLIFKPKEGESRNYKKILLWTMIFSLIMIPVVYMAKINGYLPF